MAISLMYKNGTNWSNLLDIFWPVGSIFMSNKNTNPASLVGGTWTQVSDQRVWLPATSYGSTGGAATSSHHHQLPMGGTTGQDNKIYFINRESFGANAGESYGIAVYETYIESGTKKYLVAANKAILATTTEKIMDNRPPYRTCFCWYRSA